MKMTITKQIEIEITLTPYMKSVFAFYKIEPGGLSMRVSRASVSVHGDLHRYEHDDLEPCTQAEFDAAYEMTTKRILAAYLK